MLEITTLYYPFSILHQLCPLSCTNFPTKLTHTPHLSTEVSIVHPIPHGIYTNKRKISCISSQSYDTVFQQQLKFISIRLIFIIHKKGNHCQIKIIINQES